ncbi:unnamed protein product [Diamesa tonsa]
MDLTDYLHDIPERFKDKVVHCKTLVLQNVKTTVILTNKWELLEVKDKQIVNYLNLKCFLNEKVSEIEDNETVNLFKFHSVENLERLIFYLITFGTKLFVVLRKEFKLNFIKLYENVKSFDYEDPESNGQCIVRIKFNDGNSVTSNFLNPMYDDAINDVLSEFPGIKKTIDYLQSKENEILNKINSVRNQKDQFIVNLANQNIFLPANMTTEIVDEKAPLVKYGDIWTKVCNDKLVIGIPILNCTYKR